MNELSVILDVVSNRIGVEAGTLLGTYAALALVGRVVGYLIPDDATGLKGLIRKVAKVVSLTVSNRITSGVSQNDVAKASMSIANVARIARHADQ